MGKGADGCDGQVGMKGLLSGEELEGMVSTPPGYTKEPAWLHSALYMYVGNGLSLREIGEVLGISGKTVSKYLRMRGVVLRKQAKIKPIHTSIDVPAALQDEVGGIIEDSLLEAIKKLRAIGVGADGLVGAVNSYAQGRVNSGAHFAIYADNAPFLTQKFSEAFANGLLDRHLGDGAVVSMFAFERLLAESLSATGCNGKLSTNPNHPGRDLTYDLHGETWRSSCKSESHKDVSEDNRSLRISYLMTWEPPPETAGKKIAEHISDYDYVHHLRAVQNVTFPKESSNHGQPACRYNFYQVPKHILEDISKHKLSKGTNTLVLKSRSRPGETFNVKVELHGSGKIRIPSIPLEEVDMLASFWVSPPSRREG